MNNDNTRKLAEHLAVMDASEGDELVSNEAADGPIEHTESLALRALLKAEPKAELSLHAGQRGRNTLLSAVAQRNQEGTTMSQRIATTLATRGAAVAAAVLLVGGTVGASAAFGGPNLPEQAVTLTQHALGINNAPDEAQNGKDHANPKAFSGSENASDAGATGSENAADAAATGQQNAEDGRNNSTEGIGNASPAAENGLENAAPQASLGSGNAGDNTPEVTTSTNPVGLGGPPETTPPSPGAPPSNPGD